MFLPCVVFSRYERAFENENEDQYVFVCLLIVRMTCSTGGKLLISITILLGKVVFTVTRFTEESLYFQLIKNHLEVWYFVFALVLALMKFFTKYWKSSICEDDFSSKFCCRRATAELPAGVPCHAQLRARNMTEKTKPYSSSFSSDLKPCYKRRVKNYTQTLGLVKYSSSP